MSTSSCCAWVSWGLQRQPVESQAQTTTHAVPGPRVPASRHFPNFSPVHGLNQRHQGAPELMPMRSIQGPLDWALFFRGWCRGGIAPYKPVYYLFNMMILIRLSFQNGPDKLIVCDAHWHGTHSESGARAANSTLLTNPSAGAHMLDLMLESCVIAHTLVFWLLCCSGL